MGNGESAESAHLWALPDAAQDGAQDGERARRVLYALAEPSLSRSPASGRLTLGLTLVLRRPPSPGEDSLLPLVTGGVFSAGLTVAPDPRRLEALSRPDLELRALFPTATRFELRAKARLVASAGASGSSAALSETLSREDALALLAVARGEPSDLMLTADVSYRAVLPAAEPRTVVVRLDRVFAQLASVVDEQVSLRLDDLEPELVALVRSGAIALSPASADVAEATAAALPTLLLACRPILERVEGGEPGAPARYRLAAQPPAPGSAMTLRTSAGPTEVERVRRLARPMMDLCRPAFAGQSLDALVSAICPTREGTCQPVPRKVSPVARAASRAGADSLAALGGSAAAMPAALRVGRKPPSANALLASDLVAAHPAPGVSHLPVAAHAWVLNDLVVNGLAGAEKLERYPVIADGAATWPDRVDASRRWYAPQLEWLKPAVSDAPAGSPFLFSFEVTGHDAQGRPGLEATLRLTLRAAAPDGAGNAAPVAMGGLSASLEIPYRDENGASQTHAVPATSVTAEGDRRIATFRLTDTWARLCYGALALPGFQREPVRLLASYVFPAYVPLPAEARIAFGGKTARAPVAAALHATALAAHPVLVAPALAAAALHPVRYGIRTQGRSFRLEVSVPCAQLGHLYRQSGDGADTAIGCQDAYALGQVRLKLYEPLPIDLGALRPGCRVLRSLQVPGRFLVVPQAYVIARFEPGDARAWRPAVFLFSNIDAVHPENSRCIAMATLQPDLQPYVRAALLEHLRANVHPEASLEWPTELGVAPTYQWALPGGANAIEPAAAKTPEGFQVSLATGIEAALQLKAMFERGGVNASVQFRLDDGTVLDSTLTVDLTRVNGPWSTGPVTVALDGSDATLTNRIEQAVDVGELALSGGTEARVTVGRRLAAGESLTVAAPGAPSRALAQYAYAGGIASLDEVRTFIEDIYVDALFAASLDFAASGLAELSVAAGIAGTDQSLTATLTAGAPSASVRFVLPLTSYLARPVLRYRVSGRRNDTTIVAGPWRDWPLASQGSVIDINAGFAEEK